VRIAMVLFQFLEVIEVFSDYLWVEYLCHAFIMPSTKRNGITRLVGCFTFYAGTRGEPGVGGGTRTPTPLSGTRPST
jgi:hypothetical protein